MFIGQKFSPTIIHCEHKQIEGKYASRIQTNHLFQNKANERSRCEKQPKRMQLCATYEGGSWRGCAKVHMSTYVKRKRILTHLNRVSRLNLPGDVSETACLNSLGFSWRLRHQCCIELCPPVGHSPLGRHCCCHTSQQDLSAARREGVWFHRTSLLTQGSLTVTYVRGDWSVREKICVSAHISSVLLPWKPSQLKQ